MTGDDSICLQHPGPEPLGAVAENPQPLLELIVGDRLAREENADTGDVCGTGEHLLPPFARSLVGSITGMVKWEGWLAHFLSYPSRRFSGMRHDIPMGPTEDCDHQLRTHGLTGVIACAGCGMVE